MNLRVGLTGGIGSGKSEVGKVFADLGAFLIDADVLARKAVAPGTEGLRRVFERWPHLEREDGALDREALAGIVFSQPEERAALIEIVHPFVRASIAKERGNAQPGQIIVHEVPLLFEGGLYREMDVNVLVVAPREKRIERVMARSGWSHEQVIQRMAAQIHPEEAARLATHTIQNDGTIDELREKSRKLFFEIQNASQKSDSQTLRT